MTSSNLAIPIPAPATLPVNYGCTYVETEEIADERKHYVRVKSYPDKESIYEWFVEM